MSMYFELLPIMVVSFHVLPSGSAMSGFTEGRMAANKDSIEELNQVLLDLQREWIQREIQMVADMGIMPMSRAEAQTVFDRMVREHNRMTWDVEQPNTMPEGSLAFLAYLVGDEKMLIRYATEVLFQA